MTKRPSRHRFETQNPYLSKITTPRSHNMAKKIPSSKFPTTKKKIPSRKFPKSKTKLPSRKFAKAPSEEPVAPVLPDRERIKNSADLEVR
jgi:hypothetical protein